MTHPFFDCTGLATFRPGDYGVFQPDADSYAHINILRTQMYVNRDGKITPHVMYLRNDVNCCRESKHVAKCIWYMDEEYAPIWYFPQISPFPGEDVIAWSVRRNKYVKLAFQSCADGMAKLGYKADSYEVSYKEIYRLVQNILVFPTEGSFST